MADSFIKYIDYATRAMVWYKFSDLLSLTSMVNDSAIWPKGVTFRNITEKRGKVEMEFINVWRSGTKFDWERQRTSIARGGVYGRVDNTNSATLKAVPVSLNYDVFFWSKDTDKLNQITERYCFWQHQDPNLNMLFNNLYACEFDLSFGAVIDESPIESMYDKGIYYVIRCPVTVEGWIFTSQTTGVVRTIYLKGYDATIDPSTGEEIMVDTVQSGLGDDSAIGTDTITVEQI
jgi:hypothetical protein